MANNLSPKALAVALAFFVAAARAAVPLPDSPAQTVATNFAGWSTNGASVCALMLVAPQAPLHPPPLRRLPPALLERVARTNAEAARNMERSYEASQKALNQPRFITNKVFNHYLPGSLNNLVWTNFIAHTNDRSLNIWSVRSHPPDWPARPPIVVWNTNSLIWGMKGLTALSPCWELEGSSGQVPITALTRRHGYARGHSMGPNGFRTDFAHRKVWFVTTNNVVIEVMTAHEVVRTMGTDGRDYTIFLFQQDLPPSIEPMRVVAGATVNAKFLSSSGPWPLFATEQTGHVSSGLPELFVNTMKGGDSGSPRMLPLLNELVFFGGTSTSGPSPEMQADMNTLCALQGLNPNNYQLRWVDLSACPSY